MPSGLHPRNGRSKHIISPHCWIVTFLCANYKTALRCCIAAASFSAAYLMAGVLNNDGRRILFTNLFTFILFEEHTSLKTDDVIIPLLRSILLGQSHCLWLAASIWRASASSIWICCNAKSHYSDMLSVLHPLEGSSLRLKLDRGWAHVITAILFIGVWCY